MLFINPLKNKFQLAPLLIVLLACLPIWLRQINVGHDLDYYYFHTLADVKTWPLTWRDFFVSDGMGEYTLSNLWAWPLLYLAAFLSSISLDYSLIVKVFFLLPIILLSYYSSKKLVDYYNFSKVAKVIATSFYLLNTYYLLLIDGGQFGLALAYSIFPWVFLSFKQYLINPSLKQFITSLLLILILSIFDLRIVVILVLLIAVDFVFAIMFQPSIKTVIVYLKLAGLVIIFLVLFHAFWILPALSYRLPELPLNYDHQSPLETLSFATLGHAILSIQPHWYENVFGRIRPPSGVFVLIPILVYLSPLVKKKDKLVAFWLVVAISTIFLIKGVNPPLGKINLWLFNNIFGFNLFRDPTKFYFALMLSYTVLIGVTLTQLNRLEKFRRFEKIIAVALIGYLVFLASPIFFNKTNGLFSQPFYVKNFLQMANYLDGKKDFSRVLYLPSKPSLGYVSSTHPGIGGLQLSQKRPFMIGTKGEYEVLNFLREASISGQLLNVSGVGYIADPFLNPKQDDTSDDNLKYYFTFFNQLLGQNWVEERVKESAIPLLKLKQHQDHFFVTPNVWWIIGSDNLYQESTKSSALQLSKNALIFADQSLNLGPKIKELPQAKIVLNQKNEIDLAASFLSSTQVIFPSHSLNFSPDQTGWWKRETADTLNWRTFLQTKYKLDNQDFDLGGGWAVSEGTHSLTLNLPQLPNNPLLLIRAMESPAGGELNFVTDNKFKASVTTLNPQTNVRWFVLPQIPPGSTKLTITTSGVVNVVNVVALVDVSIWEKNMAQAAELIKKQGVTSFSVIETHSASPQISYRVIDPTKYLVTVNGLQKPAMLVFSENYDPYWQANNTNPLPVYSMLNGFNIKENGVYQVSFLPQESVLPGIKVSILALLLLVFLKIRNEKF